MEKMIYQLKTLCLLLALVTIAGFAQADTYTLKSSTNAEISTNWKNSLNVGATSFEKTGDIFVIPSTLTTVFATRTLTTFGEGVLLQVDGKFSVGTGENNEKTTLIINGTIKFTNASSTQATISTNGNWKTSTVFALGINGTLITANANGIAGSDCSISTISSERATVTLPTTANYEFNGGIQILTGLPTTVNNLTISGSGTKSLTAATTVTETLSITSGSLDINGFDASAATITGSGTLTNSSSTLKTFTTGSSNSSTTFSGPVTGALGLTKTGTGTLTLSGLNTYTGATTISAGTLKLNNAAALGASTVTSVSSGATLDLNGISLSTPRPLTLNGTGISNGGAMQNSSSTSVTYSGLIKLGSASSIIANAGDISLTNTGIITGSNYGLTLGGSGNGSIASIIGTGTGTVTKTGAGTWTVSGANTYTGATTISAGTLKLNNEAALGASTVTSVSSGATLDLNGISLSTPRPLTLNGTGISNGGAMQNSSSTSVTYSGLIKLGSASSIIANAGDISLTNTGIITGSNYGLTLGGSGNGSIASIIGTGTGTVTKTGAGTWTLSGANTYTGATTISAGILKLNNEAALGASTTTTVSTGATLDLNGITLSTARPVTLNGGVLQNSASTAASYSGLITLGSASSIIANAGDISLTNTGIITGLTYGLTLGGSENGSIASIIGTGTGTLTKTGAGTWTLSGANTYTGATTISAGILKLNNEAALGASTTTTVSTGATLDLNGITLSSARPVTLNGGKLKNSTTAATLSGAITLEANSDVDVSGDLTLDGGINGLFKLTKSGTGILNIGTTPSIIDALFITAGNLTIPAGAEVTVSGETAITPANGLTIKSDPTDPGVGTGSFITGSASGDGTASVIRYMSPRRWHLVASPLSEQTIGSFLQANESIPTNQDTNAPNERGMMAYDVDNNSWGEFLTNNSTEKLTTGKGFSMRVRTSETATGTQRVTFTGQLQPEEYSVSVTPLKWNCIGNPYTSAIGIKSGSGKTADFLTVNEDNLDRSYGAIYVWHQSSGDENNVESPGAYQTISNATLPNATFGESSDTKVQQGQAFMVKIAEGKSTVRFTPGMKIHDTQLALKSTEDIWPTIQLQATANDINSVTTVAFHDGMTNGLDVTYDAGLLKADSPIDVYTRLVDDSGIPFAIQALPSDQYEQLIIPVGVDCAVGGQVSFSAKGMYLPSSCRPLLEDRLTGILTDLSDKTYTTDLTANTAGTGRFYLHTSYSSTGVVNHDNATAHNVWATGNNEINIDGTINNGAIASLYDLQGRLIGTYVMREGRSHRISLPAVNRGIYLLQVRDQQKTQVLKVTIGQ